MALVESVDIPMGSTLPPFRLPDAEGRSFESWELVGTRGTLIVFTCNHCPYAVAQWPRFVDLATYAAELGVATVAINANIHPDYPADAPPKMKKLIQEVGIKFPYLVDGTQETARQFQAQCTPDPYLFDNELALVYHGRLDDNWQDPEGVNRQELKNAIDALVSGEEIDAHQYPAIGCSIKWRKS